MELSELETKSEDELFVLLPESNFNPEKITAPRYSYWKSVFRVFFKKKTNWVILAILLVMLIFTYLYAPFIKFNTLDYMVNPNILNPQTYNLSPSKAIRQFGFSLEYCLGTGPNGESLFNHMWKGAQNSLSLSLICAAINLSIGIIVGAIWGFSKKVDTIMIEVYNIIGNIPYLLFISVFVMVVGTGFWSFVAALTVTGWLGIAYFIRTQVIIIRDREYNLASKCLGTNIWKIVTRNILPFLTSVIVTIIATEVPSYISYEVFLSYLGIGMNASTPSLGRLINTGQIVMYTYPVQFIAPVLLASTLTIILYVAGQNLADASDPRTHM